MSLRTFSRRIETIPKDDPVPDLWATYDALMDLPTCRDRKLSPEDEKAAGSIIWEKLLSVVPAWERRPKMTRLARNLPMGFTPVVKRVMESLP